ncbi:protein of unknown function [Parageobacillus thermantarcticus]|uniref:DUF4258 domain-containing protein n=1 Tax=Parageobacillus thermantarcticus TaxID=186116 RepID=A0A1I0TLP6_9BACL|nr:DUF4258 domain-containing protein [Parageobacillus thermantarcticus]SFA52718.1 protein of unknown function [Parageobacillus thermantarcticus]
MKSVYRKLKKVLMGHEGTIHISVHAKEQMNKRGYNKCDIALAIYNGKVVEKQYGKDLKMVIAGFDQSCNPIVIVVAWKGRYDFEIVTVMPPLDHRRFDKCIG